MNAAAGARSTPYRIEISSEVLEDLRSRLAATRWPAVSDQEGWEDGPPTPYLRELVEDWCQRFDWPAQQERLNGYANHVVTIDGESIHFVWLRAEPAGTGSAIMLNHGWPGSFVEFLGVGERLVVNGYDVVIPTLPGFGLPGPPRTGHWSVTRVAGAWSKLMAGLGYGRYFVHGGDIGSAVARVLGIIDAEHVPAIHVTSVVGGLPDVSGRAESELSTPAERAAWRYAHVLNAYAHVQATKPTSLGQALTDSPAGWLSWMVERYHDWTAARERPEEVIARDELLVIATLYWACDAISPAARFYKTNGFYGGGRREIPPSSTPTAVSVFGNDILISDRALSERHNTIISWREHGAGGHFPGLEAPDLLARDIRDAFAELRR